MTHETLQRHPIGVVMRRTGLKPDLIRVWQRRYGAVAPARTGTRRRLYSDADIERLQLLAALVGAGRRIGGLAELTTGELVALLRADRGAERPPDADDLLGACLTAVLEFDGPGLEGRLLQAARDLSRVHLIEGLVVPLLRRIGELWHEGALRPSHEHLASAVVRSFLGNLRETPAPPDAPVLIVTTPAGQLHELGALVAAATARAEGWAVLYLGPNLPAEEIATAAERRRAAAVALSITFPPDDPALASELELLGRLLAPGVALLVGGQARQGYRAVLGALRALDLPDLAALRRTLGPLRRSTPGR